MIGKLLLSGKSIGGKEKERQAEGRKGVGGEAQSQLSFKYLLCLLYEFPSVTNRGENSRKVKKQAERRFL